MLRRLLIDYFGFNRQQRNGLLILTMIILLLFVIRISLTLFVQPSGIELQKLHLAQQRLDTGAKLTSAAKSGPHFKKKELFYFDPNTVSHQGLIDLGLSEKQATTFLKFRQKGFVFRQKEDLKKIYGLSEALYGRISPFVRVKAADTPVREQHQDKKAVQTIPVVDLNTADSAQLTALPGIGPAYARRIIRYRSLLGGFTSTAQLNEVYGFPAGLFEKIKNNVKADPNDVKKMDPLRDDFKTLNRHPYIGYERTKAIFNKRRQGAITKGNLNEIFGDSSATARVLPYLLLDQ